VRKRKYLLVISGLLFSLSSTVIATEESDETVSEQATQLDASENTLATGVDEITPVDTQKKSKTPAQVVLPKDVAESESTSKSGGTSKSGNKLDDFLGEMKPILEGVTKVEAYLVGAQPAGEDVQAESQLGGYPVLKEPVVLSAEQLKQAQTLVLDEKSYFWGPLHKKCMLAPKVAFRFIKGNEEVSVLFSTYCNMWTFAYQDKLNTQDYAPVAEAVNKLLSTLFPAESTTQPDQQ
jgi:hypothetical protein